MPSALWRGHNDMQLILVRHGQPDVPTSGHTGNPPLTERGHEQALHAAYALRRHRIDRIISSGMVRADETAAPLASALSLPIDIVADLGEVDRWGGEYASIDAIRHKGAEEWSKFLSGPLAYFGVDPVKFRSETLEAFASVLNGGEEKTVAIFTHGFPINLLLSHALGLKDEARFVPSYGSLTRLAGKSVDALTVVSVNESGHIPERLK
jgi:broad specificity phosphatase PhoE